MPFWSKSKGSGEKDKETKDKETKQKQPTPLILTKDCHPDDDDDNNDGCDDDDTADKSIEEIFRDFFRPPTKSELRKRKVSPLNPYVIQPNTGNYDFIAELPINQVLDKRPSKPSTGGRARFQETRLSWGEDRPSPTTQEADFAVYDASDFPEDILDAHHHHHPVETFHNELFGLDDDDDAGDGDADDDDGYAL